jgi:protein-S-isoprenylcysteine O-methyltransferase Ste14
MPSISTFIIYVIAYYTVHSFLTSIFIKLKTNFKGYRLFYNLFAVLTILPIIVVLFKSAIDSSFIPWSVRVGGILLLLIGIFIHIVSFRTFSSKVFLGLEELKDEDQELYTDGLYSTVRHPFYLATLMQFWALFILFPNVYFLSFAILSTIYVIIGSRLEENKLIVHHPEYVNYRKKVPSLFPWKAPLAFIGYLFSKH